MHKKLAELNKTIAALVEQSKAIEAKAKAEDRDLSDEEGKQVLDLAAQLKTAQTERDQVKARIAELDAARSQIQAADEVLDEPMPQRALAPSGPVAQADPSPAPRRQPFTIPAEARRYTPRNFVGADAALRAYRFGMFALATMGRRNAQRWCQEHGVTIEAAGHTSTDLGAGAVFVPDEFDSELLRLREMYGVFRRYARIRPMASDSYTYNRRTGGLTAYFVGEQQAGTTSTTSTDQVKLTSRDLYCFSTMTNQLAEDAVINLADDLAYEIAYAFSQKEDNCGFNGDGTTTYGGITGVCAKLKGLSATIANIAGLVVGSGNLYSELVLGDFEAVIGKLPQYADNPNTAWFCHKTFFATVMQKLMDAGGGNNATDLAQGVQMRFLGYPVVVSQVMPSIAANSQVCCLLGDLRLAADFGDRRGTAIAFSDSATVDTRNMFMTNETAIRGHERFDINVHDVGNADATAANRVPGPVVGLITAAS